MEILKLFAVIFFCTAASTNIRHTKACAINKSQIYPLVDDNICQIVEYYLDIHNQANKPTNWHLKGTNSASNKIKPLLSIVFSNLEPQDIQDQILRKLPINELKHVVSAIPKSKLNQLRKISPVGVLCKNKKYYLWPEVLDKNQLADIVSFNDFNRLITQLPTHNYPNIFYNQLLPSLNGSSNPKYNKTIIDAFSKKLSEWVNSITQKDLNITSRANDIEDMTLLVTAKLFYDLFNFEILAATLSSINANQYIKNSIILYTVGHLFLILNNYNFPEASFGKSLLITTSSHIFFAIFSLYRSYNFKIYRKHSSLNRASLALHRSINIDTTAYESSIRKSGIMKKWRSKVKSIFRNQKIPSPKIWTQPDQTLFYYRSIEIYTWLTLLSSEEGFKELYQTIKNSIVVHNQTNDIILPPIREILNQLMELSHQPDELSNELILAWVSAIAKHKKINLARFH